MRLGCFSLKRKCCYPLQQEVPSKHMSVDWLAGHYLLGRLCSLPEKGGIYGWTKIEFNGASVICRLLSWCQTFLRETQMQGAKGDTTVSKQHAKITAGEAVPGGKPEVYFVKHPG